MVERKESDGMVELIPLSSIGRIIIKEDEKMKVNLGYYLGGVIK